MLTDLSFLEPNSDWPPKSERERLDTYNQNRRLFEGEHTRVFAESWTRLLRQADNLAVEQVLNWPKRLSTLWADLLAGDPPTFAIAEKGSPEQDQLDELIDRNQFATLLYDIAIDQSRYGDGVFKLRLIDGEAVIEGQSPSYWFPVVSVSNVREVKCHVLAWPFQASAPAGLFRVKDEKIDLIKVEIHEKGFITHRVFVIGKHKKIESEEKLSNFDVLKDIPEFEETGVEDFLVHQAPGLRPIDRLHGLNDYTDVESIVQEMEVRLAQIARVLDNHADPTMYGPEALIVPDSDTGQSVAPTGGYLPIPEDNPVTPGYVALPDTLTSSFAELEELKLQFYLITETSPAAFGQADAGLATSGTALRRLMQAPLAKARRLRMRLDPVAKKVLEVAMELEGQSGSIGQREDDAA